MPVDYPVLLFVLKSAIPNSISHIAHPDTVHETMSGKDEKLNITSVNLCELRVSVVNFETYTQQFAPF